MGVPNARLKRPTRSGAARSSAAMAYVRLTAMSNVAPEANSEVVKPSATSHPSPEARDKVLEIKTDPEELKIDGQELYIYFPNGMARAKLSLPSARKQQFECLSAIRRQFCHLPFLSS